MARGSAGKTLNEAGRTCARDGLCLTRHGELAEEAPWALVTINALPMVYDLAGQRGIGAFTGLYYFAASLAAITGPILVGRLIDSTSYRIIWPFCLLFLAVAMALMTQVRPQR